MARHLLASTTPTNNAPARVTIHHVQLRDLIICPQELGLVNYIQGRSIVEHDLYSPNIAIRNIANLSFLPNTLASIQVPGSDLILLAAGGQEAEIYLSLRHASSRSQRRGDPAPPPRSHDTIWWYDKVLNGSINNSVSLSSLSLTRSAESSVEPCLIVNNNDSTIRFYDIAVRSESPPKDLRHSGSLKLEEPINHSSISPDGRTLLSVGDSPRVHLHHLTGGSCITFAPIVTLVVPPSDARLPWPMRSASFSTAFSCDGMKFAVASEEGVVTVWDVRNTKPMKIIQTDKTGLPVGKPGAESGIISSDPWDWTRGMSKPPGWGARCVKFGGGPGHEIMTFTEHTNLLHVIDARTFETEDIIRIPNFVGRDVSHDPLLLYPPLPDLSATSRVKAIAQPPPRTIRTLEESSHVGPFPYGGTLSTRRDSEDVEGYNYENIPGSPVGDNAVQENIRGAFVRWALHTYLHRGDIYSQDAMRGTTRAHVYDDNDVGGDGREDVDSLNIDELETDTSFTYSRSYSPPPSTRPSLHTSPPPSPSNCVAEHPQNADLDIAGMCFDPHGEMIYVATTDSISEWAIKHHDIFTTFVVY